MTLPKTISLISRKPIFSSPWSISPTQWKSRKQARQRFIASKWNILEVSNGDEDIQDIYEKLLIAKNSTDKPTIIFVKTTIGYGSKLAGKSSIHGAPLGVLNTQYLKEYYNFDKDKSFIVDEDVFTFFSDLRVKKKELYDICNNTISDYKKNHNYEINNAIKELREFKNTSKSYATRDSSNMALNILAKNISNMIVGSADLAESNKTMISDNFIANDNFTSQYLHYGIREHAMASIANGISTYDIIPIVSTFFVFITYCLAPIRMAALSKHAVIYVLTHDSVFLGEDGPTHQPVESLTILRSIPNLLTLRPCDTTEVSGAYQIALQYNGPCALILSRQIIPNIENSCIDKMKKGAYIVYEPETKTDIKIQLIIVATGSEVILAIDVAKKMGSIRVVSMPCCELFDNQEIEYKEDILPKNIKKMSLEAGVSLGWYKYVDYTYGIDSFGESGQITDIKEHFGFTLEKINKFINKNVMC